MSRFELAESMIVHVAVIRRTECIRRRRLILITQSFSVKGLIQLGPEKNSPLCFGAGMN